MQKQTNKQKKIIGVDGIIYIVNMKNKNLRDDTTFVFLLILLDLTSGAFLSGQSDLIVIPFGP